MVQDPLSDRSTQKIWIGTAEMRDFFKENRIHYIPTYMFARVFDQFGLPGKLLLVGKEETRNLQLLNRILKEDGVIRLEDLKQSMEQSKNLYLKSISEIHGHGLFAGENIPSDQILSVYAGEVIFYDGIDRGKEKLQVPVTDELVKDFEAKHPGEEFTVEREMQWFSGLAYSYDVRGGYYLAQILDSHPVIPTAPIAVDATSYGNETRFINHAKADRANVKPSLRWMRAMDFYQLSSHFVFSPEDFECFEKALVGFYMPVMFIVSSKVIQKDSQLLMDYGKHYWKTLGVTPVDF